MKTANYKCLDCGHVNNIPEMVGFAVYATWQCGECWLIQNIYKEHPVLTTKPMKDFEFEVRRGKEL